MHRLFVLLFQMLIVCLRSGANQGHVRPWHQPPSDETPGRAQHLDVHDHRDSPLDIAELDGPYI